MTGYRDTSNYEPFGRQPGPPLKPYNWVQWTGVAFLTLSLLAYGYYFAARIGWVPEPQIKPVSLGLPLLLVGMILVYSRREPAPDLAPELAAERKRWLIIVAVICAVILGAAAIIDLQGA